MDIRSTLERSYSKAGALQIADYIGSDPERFQALMDIFLFDEYRISQRSAWVLSHVADRHLFLIHPYIEAIIDRMLTSNNDAIKRNTLRIFAMMELPEEWQGRMVDICFNLLDNPKEPIAVRVHAMQNLWNICQKEPELIPELKVIIEDHMATGSAGLRSRGGKILRAMERLLR
ncbi:MAG: hypothetical protein AAGH79_11665 [Bacteroidota bacterium]